eukprot:2563370-Pyramimonas_sp.AAC.1
MPTDDREPAQSAASSEPAGEDRRHPWSKPKEATCSPPVYTDYRVAEQTAPPSAAARWETWQAWEGWDHRQDTWSESDWRTREKRSAPRGDAQYADKRQRGRDFARKWA